MKALRIGDTVKTPDGHIGKIIQIDTQGFEDRGGQQRKFYLYYVPSPLPGSPVEWWMRHFLKKVTK